MGQSPSKQFLTNGLAKAGQPSAAASEAALCAARVRGGRALRGRGQGLGGRA